MRTAAEESGPQDYKFSSTGYEPNDYFLTETCVEFNQESVTEKRFPEDLDYDDTVIGQTLFNAYRRRVDHSEGEGLSSGLSSSSMSHDRTGKPVVDRDKSHESGCEIQRQNSENEQIRTLLERQRCPSVCLMSSMHEVSVSSDFLDLFITFIFLLSLLIILKQFLLPFNFPDVK